MSPKVRLRKSRSRSTSTRSARALALLASRSVRRSSEAFAPDAEVVESSLRRSASRNWSDTECDGDRLRQRCGRVSECARRDSFVLASGRKSFSE